MNAMNMTRMALIALVVSGCAVDVHSEDGRAPGPPQEPSAGWGVVRLGHDGALARATASLAPLADDDVPVDAGADAESPAADDDAGAAEPLTCIGTSASGAQLWLTWDEQSTNIACGCRWRDGDGAIRTWSAWGEYDSRLDGGQCSAADDANDVTAAHFAMQPWAFRLIAGVAVATSDSGERVVLDCE